MNTMLRSSVRWWTACAFTLSVIGSTAWADDAPTPIDEREASAATREPVTGIEEITVTARKREESLQETPISITAFTELDLEDQEIRRIGDIQATVPNLQFDQAVGQANAARISIRGVGNGDAISTDDPGVGVYIDGVYLPRAQGALLSVSDIARIEVLRGPQGTLFGKNTVGGAVNIITQKPSFERSGNAEIRVGNYDLFETKLMLNVPLIPERLATRWSFTSKQREGFTKNRFNGGGSTLGRDRMLAGRGQLLLNASDQLELLLSVDHSIEPRTPPAGKCKFIGARPAGSRTETPPGSDTGAAALSAAAQLANLGDRAAFEKACRAEDQRDDFKTRQDARFEDELITYGTSLIATWSPRDFFTFKSTTSWRRNETKDSGDNDLTELAINQDGRSDNDNGEQDAISQEFNFSGIGIDGRLNWTAGLYGFVEDNQDNSRGQTLPITNNRPALLPLPTISGLRPTTTDGLGPCIAGSDPMAATCLREFVGPRTKEFLKSSTTSYAAYTQATFDVTTAFSITGGIRLTHERKRFARLREIDEPLDEARFSEATRNNGGVTIDLERSARFSKWTPMLNLQYRFNEDVNIYATYSRGFKSGGFNGRATDVGGSLDIDPEVLTSYELGMKSSWLDRRLILNAAAFTNVYQDIQLTVITNDQTSGNLVARVDNAGKAVINGLELEVVAAPWAGLTLNGGLGVSAARYVKFDRAGFGNVKLPNTPTYTMNFGVAYALPLSTYGDLRTRFDWSHVGTKASDVTDPHFNRVKKHGVLRGRIAFELADGVTEIAIFGDNLLDRRYLSNAVDGLNSTLRFYAPPRTFGLEIKRRF